MVYKLISLDQHLLWKFALFKCVTRTDIDKSFKWCIVNFFSQIDIGITYYYYWMIVFETLTKELNLNINFWKQ